MAIIGIVAIAKNLAIGRDGKLPWHYSADLKFFKATTTGHAVVMGAGTWRSIGRSLLNRVNIVLSRSGNVDTPSGVLRFSSRDELIDFARTYDRDIYVIGGAKTYETFADVIERWLVTDIPDDVADADTFISANYLDDFELINTTTLDGGLNVRVMQRRKN